MCPRSVFSAFVEKVKSEKHQHLDVWQQTDGPLKKRLWRIVARPEAMIPHFVGILGIIRL
jgi:hypothetical protein